MPMSVSTPISRMKLPARYMSCEISARSSSGPAVGRLSTMAVMVTPEMSSGSTQPIAETNGLSAMRTGYLRTSRRSGQALGLGGDDIGLVEFVGEVGAQDADQRGRAGRADDDDRDPQMGEEVEELGQGPGRVDVLRRIEAADALSEIFVGEVHQRQREDEVRDGEADEAEEGEDVVADRVAADGRVDADRQRHRPDEEQRGDRDGERRPHPLPDQLGDRPVPLERVAEVAVEEDAADPLPVLHQMGSSKP